MSYFCLLHLFLTLECTHIFKNIAFNNANLLINYVDI